MTQTPVNWEPKQQSQVLVIKQLTQTNEKKCQAPEKEQDLKRAVQKRDIIPRKTRAKDQRELQQEEER